MAPPPPNTVPTLDVRRFHQNPARELVALARYMQPAMRVRTGNSAFVHVCHPDTARYVLQTNNSNYLKDFSPFEAILGDSLLCANGDKWRALRARMQPAFAASRLRGSGRLAIEAADRMLEPWLRAAGTGKRIDVMPGFVSSTLEFVATSLFTLSPDFITEADLAAIEVGLKMGGRAMHFGSGMGPGGRAELMSAVAQLDEMAARAVAIRRSQSEKPEDLLTLMIEALDDPEFPVMTPKQIRDDILTFLLAGHETTSTALGWAVRLISRRDHVQQRMREEVLALGDRDPDEDDLKALAYTTAVFNEAMRMRPPVPLMIRMAAENDRIDNVNVVRGMRVGVSILGIHHHPEFWPNPETFDPERFLGNTERAPNSFLPFSAGPRSCIGIRLAMIEGPLMLARIIQKLRVVPAQNPPLVSQSVVTLRPRDGQFVGFERWA